jgi:hypothetical protein
VRDCRLPHRAHDETSARTMIDRMDTSLTERSQSRVPQITPPWRLIEQDCTRSDDPATTVRMRDLWNPRVAVGTAK